MFALLRVKQWYKNLLVFLPLVFSGNLFNTGLLLMTIEGFFALCFISSSNYILNDILDRKRDRKNKEKRSRPIASGRVSVWQASIVMAVLILLSFMIGVFLSNTFTLALLALFFLGIAYSVWLKHEAFADVLIIGVNFVIRAISGAFIISVYLSPWLILCPFFLAIYLAVGKRRAESAMLGRSGTLHRPSLKSYTPQVTSSLMTITTALLIISYSLYSFLSVQDTLLLITIPIMMYAVFRFNILIEEGSDIARHPERVIKDVRMVISAALWTLLVLVLLYI